MKKSCLAFLLSVFLGSLLSAQSYHFSQFFSTPLLTNPANTGYIEGNYRLASNFRSQGKMGSGSLFTGYVSADFSLMQNRLSEGYKAGAGIYIMNDQTLNGAIQNNSIAISSAYHIGLDEYGEYSIGLGFQGVYHQRTLDYSKLSFGNQFGPGGYDPSLPIGESLGDINRQYFDVNAGMVYNAILENKSFFGGLSVYNILRHKENVLPDEFKMPMRLMLQTGAQQYIGEFGKVYVSLTHLRQAGARETTLGAAYGHQLPSAEDIKNEINFGLWYRYKDALIPYVGYHRNAFQVGLSYDHTVSALKTGSQVRNGYELTLLYKAVDKRNLRTLIPWY